MDPTNLLESMKKFNDKSRKKTKEGKDKERNTFDSLKLSAFSSGIFPAK